MQTMMEKALELAEYGFSVIPLGSPLIPPWKSILERSNGDKEQAKRIFSKMPLVQWDKYKFESASLEQVEQWWQKWPHANIGLVLSDLVVVDADDEEAEDWCFKHLPGTFMQSKTARGTHFFFKRPKDFKFYASKNRVINVDVKTDGGYVVAPGSTHYSGHVYRFVFAPGFGIEDVDDLPTIDLEELGKIEKALQGYKEPDGGAGTFVAKEHIREELDESHPEEGFNNKLAALVGKWIADGLAMPDIYKAAFQWNNTAEAPIDPTTASRTVSSVIAGHMRRNPDRPIPMVCAQTVKDEDEAKDGLVATPRGKGFPKHLLNPGGLVGEIAEFINETAIKQQPFLAVGAALTALGAVMGRKVETDGSGVRTNLYTVAIADSGAGKDHPRKVIKALFDEVGCLDDLIPAESIGSDAGLVEAMSQNPCRLYLLDEYGRYLKSLANPKASGHLANITTLIMQLFGSSNTIFSGASLISRKAKKFHSPHLSIYGTTVPGQFFSALDSDSLVDGFMSRHSVFFSLEGNQKPRKNKGRIEFKEEHQPMLSGIASIYKMPVHNDGGTFDATDVSAKPKPRRYGFTDAAERVRDEITEYAFRRQNELNGEKIADIWTRVAQQADQYALIVTVGKRERIISEESMRFGADLARYLTDTLVEAIGSYLADSKNEAQIKMVLRVIEKAGGSITASQLCKRTYSLTIRQREEVLATLKKSERLVEELETGTGGRNKTVYRLI